MSTTTLILLLTNARLSVHSVDRQRTESLLDMSTDDDDYHTPLRALLRNWQSANFHILTDLAEEDFQYESVPHLSGADQQALFTRKLEQIYRLTPYRRIVVQEKGARGAQDKIMLSALTIRDRLDRIVDALLEEKCALLGIHSVALASSELMRHFQLDLPHLLLISHTEAGSLRQSYFNYGDLRFSRLGSSQSGTDSGHSAADIAEETRRTRQYLTTLRSMGRDESLEALLLTDASDSADLAVALIHELQADNPQIRASSSAVADIAKRIGLPASCSDWRTLLLLAIARGKVRNHYRPAHAGRYHLLQRIGQTMVVSAILIAITSVLLGWQGYSEAQQLQAEIDRNNRELRLETERKKTLDAQIKAITAEQPTAMKEAVSLYTRYLKPWPDVDRTAQAISRELEASPLLMVERFKWINFPSAVLPSSEGGEDPRTVPAAADGQPGGNNGLVSDGRRWQFVDISGQILPFQDNYREALSQLDQLMAQLNKQARTTTKLIKTPLDISPQGTIDLREETQASQESKAEFTLRITIAPEEGVPQ